MTTTDGWISFSLPAAAFNPLPKEPFIRLYRNNRDGTFSDVTASSGLGRSVWAAGITVGDYDK